MTLGPLSPHDHRIIIAVEHHKLEFGLPATARPAATVWMGVFDERGCLVLVVGEAQNGVYREITDLYPMPGSARAGVRAFYYVMREYKKIMESGEKLMVRVLWRNTKMRKAMEKIIGIQPQTVVYFSG